MSHFHWQQAEGKRHAYRSPDFFPAPGRSFTTLCNSLVTPQAPDDFLEAGGKWLDPTCKECEDIWMSFVLSRKVSNSGELLV